jgi:hypothetical protein
MHIDPDSTFLWPSDLRSIVLIARGCNLVKMVFNSIFLPTVCVAVETSRRVALGNFTLCLFYIIEVKGIHISVYIATILSEKSLSVSVCLSFQQLDFRTIKHSHISRDINSCLICTL